MNDEVMFARQDEMVALNTVDDTVDSQKYLIFMADHLKLGVVAEDVVEILNNQVITYLPMVPSFIRGIINMRGQMIPILDICSRMGLPSREDDSLVVVINLGDVQLGILVDGVDKMVDVLPSSILPMPTQNPQKLISGMCSLPEGKTLLILDCGLLLHE